MSRSSSLIMKLRRAALAASAASLLGAPQAFAQADKADETPQEPAKAEEGAAKEPGEPGQAAAAPADQGQVAVPDAAGSTYTIQTGDTLWDLSNKFLASPWYWPKIWSANPYIENPHWIYPGQKLRIKVGPGGQRVAVAEAQEDATAKTEEKQEEGSPPSLPTETKKKVPDFAVLRHGQREFTGMVQESGRLAFVPSRELSIKTAGIISNQEEETAGEINASFEEKALLARTDTAYVKLKGDPPKVGEKYAIFRRGDSIVHPETHQVVGRRIRILGEAKVVSVQNDIATIVIQSANEEIERGDLLASWANDSVKQVASKPNTKSVDAVILGAENNDLSALGQGMQVFIDKGTADGVEVGNTLVVHRKGDGLGSFGGPLKTSFTDQGHGRRDDNPDEDVGLLLVVDAKDKVSTALVLKSIRELLVGEHAQMRPATGTGSGGY